jgi:hypothetical protein
MRLEIDYHYKFTWVPYRAINDRSAHAAAKTVVEIPEATGADAPVVMRVGNGSGGHGTRSRFGKKEDGSLREVRFHEGRYFVEVAPADLLADRAAQDLDSTPFKGCHAWVSKGVQKQNPSAITTLDAVQARERDPLRRSSDDGGVQTAAKLARRAASLLVVDGVLFQPTAEPVLKMESFSNAVSVDARPAPDGARYSEFDFYAGYTYGSERFVAMSAADSLLSVCTRGKTAELKCEFEVVDASKSTFDGAAHDLSRMAKEVLRSMKGDASVLTREGLQAMYHLRGVMGESMVEPGRYQVGSETVPVVSLRLIEALDRIAALDGPDMGRRRAIAARHLARSDVSDYRRRETVAAKMGDDKAATCLDSPQTLALEARSRWDARPRDLGWEDRCMPMPAFKDEDRKWSRQLLSVGQVKDACAALGIDAEPVLEAVRNGATVLAAGQGDSGAVHGLAVVSPDGRATMLGRGDDTRQAYASTIERHLMAAERGVEAMFDLLPIASPSA